MDTLKRFKIKIFADGAKLAEIREAYDSGIVAGFTTNPALMKKAGVNDYEGFAKKVLEVVRDKPVSFEVFSDDFNVMENEALKISSWGENVNVKIPITNTKGEYSSALIKRLSDRKIYLNVTAITTVAQVEEAARYINPGSPAIISVFAGRIADTGKDPCSDMKEAARILKKLPKAELLWASSREVLNIFQARDCGCQIITVTPEILKKIHLIGKDLELFSLETVKGFHQDAVSSGYKL